MASKSINLTTLKRYMKDATKEQLAADIADLFAKIEPVKDYYTIRLQPGDDTDVAAKYRAIIKKEFMPDRGFGKARLSVAKAAVTDYKKVAIKAESIADIMLYYVEMGVKFTNAYGDIDEQFYNSMASMYEDAVELIVKYGLQNDYYERCEDIVNDTGDIGWGFNEDLSDTFKKHFTE